MGIENREFLKMNQKGIKRVKQTQCTAFGGSDCISGKISGSAERTFQEQYNTFLEDFGEKRKEEHCYSI